MLVGCDYSEDETRPASLVKGVEEKKGREMSVSKETSGEQILKLCSR